MSSIQSFTSNAYTGYTVDYDVGSGISRDYSESSCFMAPFTSSTSNSWCTINNTGKNKLFPNETANPIKADITYNVGAVGSGEARFYVGGAEIFNDAKSGSTVEIKSHLNLTNSTIVSAQKSTEIKWVLAHDGFSGIGIGNIFITLFFNCYDFTAIGFAGVTAHVSQTEGYDGDTVTFKAFVEPGYIFDGWYSGTTKVSNNLNYVHTVNGADLTLIAKTKPLIYIAIYCGDAIIAERLDTDIVNITYNGQTKATVSEGQKKIIKTGGKFTQYNIGIGEKELQCANKAMLGDVYVYCLENSLILEHEGDTPGKSTYDGSCITPLIRLPNGCRRITINTQQTAAGYDCLHEYDAIGNYISYWGAGENPRTFDFDGGGETVFIKCAFNVDKLAQCSLYDETNKKWIWKPKNE